MSWSLVAKLRATLAEEQSSVPVKRGGRLHICLIYPNRYRLAIGNLGWQSLYALLNEFPDVVCERAFLPEPVELAEYERSRTPLLSLESQRPVAEFDVVAFSISFESDFLNLPVICRLAGIPLWSRERTTAMPLVLGGGAALFLNPEPVADFFDLICLGEAEPLLPELVARLLDVRHRDRT
ncbi:MAG TPA: radical SAM protein, partial [Geobacteraceae bacterium]